MAAVKRVDFRLTGPQSKAFRLLRPKSDINLEWGRGCGKSWFDRFLGWITIAQYEQRRRVDVLSELGWDMTGVNVPQNMRGARVVYLMPSLKQFKAVHGAGLKAEVADWSHLRPHANWTDWRIEFPGGSWLQPFPAEAHNSENARGLRADVVVCDEADDIDPSVFESIVRPWFSEHWSLKIRVTSGTYKRGRHGLLWQRRVAGRDPSQPRYHTIHATYRDSPEIVDPQEVEDARLHTQASVFAREWECDPDSAEGLVYPFVESFHVREPSVSQWSEILIGCDHGYEDPGCFLLIGVAGSGRDAVCWVLDEIYQQHRTEDWWKSELSKWLRWYPEAKFYGDPSMPSRIEAYRKDCRAKVQPVDNSIEDGVSAVADRLAIRERTISADKTERYAKLYVAPRCVNTIREFSMYKRKRDPRNREAFQDEIEDRNNHCLEGGTLVGTSRGMVPIQQVTPGDLVLTRAGWRRVQWSGLTFASAPLWTIETTVGTLSGTPDHRIWTENRGWVRLDSLAPGDILLSWESTASRSPSCTTERPFGGTRTHLTRTLPITGAPSGGATCIESSGQTITGPSLAGITSTTRTEILSTTRSGISSACWASITCRGTAEQLPRSTQNGGEVTSSALGLSLFSGMPQPRGGSGTANTASASRPALSPGMRSALSAQPLTRPRSALESSSALEPVLPAHVESQASTTSRAGALLAESHSSSIDTAPRALAHASVLASYAAGRSAPVYDLTIDGEHEFFANGVLVHNSMDALRYPIFNRFGGPDRRRGGIPHEALG